MTETISDRVQRYALEGDDADLRRLVSIAEVLGEPAREALGRTGIADGWQVLDCGCGPLGALAVLAELVGPSGRVAGVDFVEDTARRARTVAATLGLDNVQVVAGDIHDLDPTVVGAPFDLVFARCFLLHQSDPVRTLGRISQLLRPGGWLIAHDPLREPAPRAHPPLAAVPRAFDLAVEVIERSGARAVKELPQAARTAGLEIADIRGFFRCHPVGIWLELHAATLAAAKTRAMDMGAASEQEIDELIEALRSAPPQHYDWVSSPFFLELTLRKPLNQ